MNTFIEVIRHTFPRKLRFDQASQIFYAECYSLSRRNKHNKYIPKADIQEVLDRYAPLPGRPWLQLPIIRQVLLVRQINAVRRYYGHKSWLCTRGVQEEHAVLQSWLQAQGGAPVTTSASTASLSSSPTSTGASKSTATSRTQSGKPFVRPQSGRLALLVDREKFDREVLGSMHVATMYQRMVRVGIMLVVLLIALMFASLNTDYFVYMYLRYWRRMSRAEILEWFRGVTEAHMMTEVPSAYRKLIPPPCVRYTDADSEDSYAINIVELACAERDVSVIALPCPQMGEKAFFAKVGEVAQACDSVLMEGVTFEKIDKVPPVDFLPLKEDTFPALGVHHRYLDILRTDLEPPLLFPAGAEVGWRTYVTQAITPFEVQCVYKPTAFSATKGEARVGWGRLRDHVDQVAAMNEEGEPHAPPHVICLPWTVNQIVNLEASLIKYGFKVEKVFPVHWITADYLGKHFCDYYSIVE